MPYANTSILPPIEGESESTSKKFRNTDTEEFVFTWDSKPFGGALPDRIKSWEEEVIDRDMMEREIGRRIVRKYEVLKPIMPNEVVILPKYLVNFAAMHLARKILKRNILATKTEIEKKVGLFPLRDEKEERKLQEKMVADNFEEPKEETPKEPEPVPTIPTEEKKMEESKKPEEVSWKCEICGFVAKSKLGLTSHKRFKHK